MSKEDGKLAWYMADLHVHSVLSPCAELEMGPANVIEKCREVGINILGICDHNSGANVPAFKKKGKENNILTLAGIEVQTREEVHCLCFFPHTDNLKYFEKEFKGTLPKINNSPKIFGDQVVVNENEEILYQEERLLLTSSELGLKDLKETVESYDGGVIPAHIDKKYYSLIFNLGFIPPYNFLAMEIFDYLNRKNLINRYKELSEHTLIVSSDAHTLDGIDKLYYTYFLIATPTWDEIILALKNKNGRKVVVSSRK